MAFEVGNQPISKKPVEKINEELMKIEGYLTDKEASEVLVKFLKSNIGYTAKTIGGVDLFPFQEIAIKTMFKRDYILGVWSRGLSKSFSTAVFAFLHACFQPGAKIAIISRSFRQSREIFKRIEEIAEKHEGSLLAECFNGPVRHNNDEWSMRIGSSEIKALPLGDGEKLRGFRFNCLIIDELLLMPEKVMNEVLLPFLAVNADPKKRQDTYDEETEFIKQGLMTEEDRTQFPNPKMIGLSSASYTFEHLYRIYEEYISKIRTGTQKEADGSDKPLDGSYAVLQFAYAIAPTQLYSASLIAKSRAEMSDAQFRREFGAQFTDDSSSFYSAKAMGRCTVPFGETPVVELRGTEGAKYFLSVDPSWAENEGSDFFAMEVFKILPNGRYMQVHTYAVAGGKLKDHIDYFIYLWTHFNIQFIVMDNAGGLQFLSSVNERMRAMKQKEFKEIKEVNFEETVDYQRELKLARNKYNLADRCIVYLQTFNSDWILRANHLLQANINNMHIKFAGEASSVESEYMKLLTSEIPIEHIKFVGQSDVNEDGISENVDASLDSNVSEKKGTEAKRIDFIERQEFLIRLTKTQCALIEPKPTDGGARMSFVLPNNLKNQKGANKTRKDLYTCLLIGCWANKCYNDMMTLPDEKPVEWMPFFAK